MAAHAGRTMQARFEIPLHPDSARAVHDALALEADEGPEGSTIRLRLDQGVLHVEVEAVDLSTLRAAMHSALRLLDAAQRVVAGRDA